jgi:hypothetical protein
MQALSLAWGILAVLGMVVGFIPCLGWTNWLNIPFAVAGLIFSFVVHVSSAPARRGSSLAAIILCLIAVLLGSKRLALGLGIF